MLHVLSVATRISRRLIFGSSFFAHCSNDKSINAYKKQLDEEIFITIELSKCSYLDVMSMPVARLRAYKEWKIKWDREVAKAKQEELENL